MAMARNILETVKGSDIGMESPFKGRLTPVTIPMLMIVGIYHFFQPSTLSN